MGREDLAEVMGRFSFFWKEKRSHVDEFQVFSLYVYIYIYFIYIYFFLYVYII